MRAQRGPLQLAAGLAAAHANGRVRVLSAGTDPDAAVDRVMLASLRELGIDRSDQVPTRLTDQLLAQADVVVAFKPGLGLVPAAGAVLETWILPEPGRWDVDGIRPLRDHLQVRVRNLIGQLSGQGGGGAAGTENAAKPAATSPAAANTATIAG